ncbi:MAG: transglycosylase SLT domain-containing protein [Holosporales bacterium]|jgi:soluble lytic murein transglycosylase-like protein|nr:transglycosylase SLT domain-containing protein [Holosporales bacterium]
MMYGCNGFSAEPAKADSEGVYRKFNAIYYNGSGIIGNPVYTDTLWHYSVTPTNQSTNFEKGYRKASTVRYRKTSIKGNSKRKSFQNQTDISLVIARAEKDNGIPRGLLMAIAKVESGCDPYSVNAKHRSIHFKSKAKAEQFIDEYVKSGYSNMSVGCMQIHYHSHRKHFPSASDMLDSKKNVTYAANLLKSLYKQCGNWTEATKKYHGSHPKSNTRYCEKVLAAYGKNNID